MSEKSTADVRLDRLVLPSAALGDVNPLPPLAGDGDLHASAHGDDLDEQMSFGLGYGKVATVLPYLMQDGYGRELHDAEHPVAVLENAWMRAEFLLDAGGRLWSLVDKRADRELLSRNPAFRPANLALRNAWLAGGVEWNLGTTGHWPLTSSPLHAVKVRRPDGSAALRLYEYERMRGLVVRIDAALASDAPLLTVTVTLQNPRDTEVPVYWWSNIAVPESDDVRVLAPADSAYHFDYTGELSRVPFPFPEGDGDGERQGHDASYTTRWEDAADYFFDVRASGSGEIGAPHAPGAPGAPHASDASDASDAASEVGATTTGPTQIPWIAALDGDGRGLFQLSTPRLRGRKLFRWGTGPGSAHWQRWLTEGEHPYLEIQAGLARTQLEHLPLPAHDTWRWTEVYGLAQADAGVVHGGWTDAVREAAGAIAWTGAHDALEREHGRNVRGDVVEETLQRASGWGALEDLRRARAGEPPLSSADTPFPVADLGPEQLWWAAALEGDVTPDADPTAPPAGYLVDASWHAVTAAAPGWLARLHEGVQAAAQAHWNEARAAWRASIEACDNGWAWRNLAVAALQANDTDEALRCYGQSLDLLPGLLPLSIEFASALLAAGRPEDALELIAALDAPQQQGGRLRFLRARAALAAGDLDLCGALLEEGIEIADLKEGEESLNALWTRYHAARIAADEGIAVDDSVLRRAAEEFPPPARYDFRMRSDD